MLVEIKLNFHPTHMTHRHTRIVSRYHTQTQTVQKGGFSMLMTALGKD